MAANFINVVLGYKSRAAFAENKNNKLENNYQVNALAFLFFLKKK